MRTKVLPRTTPCTLFKINAPIWNGNEKRREVGLNQRLIGKHNEIQFTYVRKSDGQRSIPGAYYFDGNKLNQLDFEKQNVKGTTLVIVPFDELEELKRENDPEDSLEEWLNKPGYARSKEELNA